jgi:hypothetical protein
VYEVPQHLRLSENERKRIFNRILDDVRAANSDHQARIAKFRRYIRAYRNADRHVTDASKANHPNYRVPVIQATLRQALAAEMQSLFGTGFKITAEPTEVNDIKSAAKVGAYMQYRVISYMKIYAALCAFDLRRLLFGRSIAYRPWVYKEFECYDRRKQAWVKKVCYDGPGFFPLLPDDVILPAEEGSIQDVSFVVRKFRVTPQQLLEDEEKGHLVNIKSNWDKIMGYAKTRRTRSVIGDNDDLKQEQDDAEGVEYDGSNIGSSETMVAYEWYGRWRLKRRGDPAADNIADRELAQTDLVVTILPDINGLLIGCQRLRDRYPTMKDKRPFYDSTLLKDGSSWPMGLGEMLEKIEDALSNNRNLAIRAQQFSVGPVIFYTSGSGFNPDGFTYEPFSTYEIQDADGIREFKMNADLNSSVMMEQAYQADAEKASGRTDYQAGRDIDRPTAPRTATGLLTLVQEGRVQAQLDMLSFEADNQRLLDELWQLEQCFGDEQTAFRVTGEDMSAYFDTKGGLAQFSSEDRDGHYDFKLTFAESEWTRKAKMDRLFQLYQIASQDPMFAQNPHLKATMFRQLCDDMGFPEFGKLVPVPPQLSLPRTPSQEWTLMQQGEDVEPHEMDDDHDHIKRHQRQLADAEAIDDEKRDEDAILRLKVHLAATVSQQKQKRLMQALISMAAQSMAKQQQQHPLLNQLGGGPDAGLDEAQGAGFAGAAGDAGAAGAEGLGGGVTPGGAGGAFAAGDPLAGGAGGSQLDLEGIGGDAGAATGLPGLT